MVDDDPNLPPHRRPPDPPPPPPPPSLLPLPSSSSSSFSASRHRPPRSHKPKNTPRKQPQRGLGVAQLEKLRLQEQQQQQQQQQQQKVFSFPAHQNHLLQQIHHSQTLLHRQPSPSHPSSSSSSSSFNLIDDMMKTPPSFSTLIKPDASFPTFHGVAPASVNVQQNSFIPLAGMAMSSSRQHPHQQSFTLPLFLSQQHQQVVISDDRSIEQKHQNFNLPPLFLSHQKLQKQEQVIISDGRSSTIEYQQQSFNLPLFLSQQEQNQQVIVSEGDLLQQKQQSFATLPLFLSQQNQDVVVVSDGEQMIDPSTSRLISSGHEMAMDPCPPQTYQSFLPPNQVLPNLTLPLVPSVAIPDGSAAEAEYLCKDQHSDNDMLLPTDHIFVDLVASASSMTEKEFQEQGTELMNSHVTSYASRLHHHHDLISDHELSHRHVTSAVKLHYTETINPELTDLSLRQFPAVCSPPEQDFPSPRNLHESPMVSIVPDGVEMRELSSFQTISLCPTWSSLDQAFNRKRPWASIHNHASHLQAFKGVDLNASADEIPIDEIQSESFEQDTGVSIPSASGCSECGSIVEEKCRDLPSSHPIETSDALVDGTGFLSLRKSCFNYEARDVRTRAEFLTLGPVCSIPELLGSLHMHTDSSNASASIKMMASNDSSSFMHRKASCHQVNDVDKLFCMVSGEHDVDGLIKKIQMKDNLTNRHPWMTDGQSSHLPRSHIEESLDLELRLSI